MSATDKPSPTGGTFVAVPDRMGASRKLLGLAVLAAALFHSSLVAQPAQPEASTAGAVHILRIEGVINPISHRYLERELVNAEGSRAELVILELDTPGGLESSMRQMAQLLLNSKIPVAVFVAPPGARAASAGMFLTIAADIAAMAPGTNIGAAHPVSIGAPGAEPGPEPTDQNSKKSQQSILTEKVVNDAAALARAIAKDRGRNAEWAEKAVRESVSITADEALRDRVIDLIAPDTASLLQKLHGREIRRAEGPRVITTRGAKQVARPMSFPERLLQAVTDPNIAYLLMTIGFIGIIAELYNPGMIFPGVTGVISLILAYTAIGSFPVNWAGVLLLAIGIGLFALELLTEGFGVLGVAGILAFALGSLILYKPFEPVSPSMPAVEVSPWLIGLMLVLVVGFFTIVLRAILKARRRPVATGIQALVGTLGTALTELAPEGEVRVGTEIWRAELTEAATPIHVGERVRIVAIEGVTLKVSRAVSEEAAGVRSFRRRSSA